MYCRKCKSRDQGYRRGSKVKSKSVHTICNDPECLQRKNSCFRDVMGLYPSWCTEQDRSLYTRYYSWRGSDSAPSGTRHEGTEKGRTTISIVSYLGVLTSTDSTTSFLSTEFYRGCQCPFTFSFFM